MKRNSSNCIDGRLVIWVITLVVSVCSVQAYCQTDGTALLLQQTPVGSGTITPAIGVHRFGVNSEVTLTAVPKPGYQFLYWIGDVGDTTANSTVVYLDAPKIVIAVFERSTYQFSALLLPGTLNAPARGVFGSAADYARGGIRPIGRRPREWHWPELPKKEEPDFPVPDQSDDNDFPVPEPVPEPATCVMLVLGGLIVFARRRTRRKT
ncbi:PEP-CTERM sorting domain-containing protein [Planctomycetota bacterium]